MKSYHFTFGGDDVNICARVFAKTKAQAVKQLRAALPDKLTLRENGRPTEYVRLYIDKRGLDASAIDDIDVATPEETRLHAPFVA